MLSFLKENLLPLTFKLCSSRYWSAAARASWLLSTVSPRIARRDSASPVIPGASCVRQIGFPCLLDEALYSCSPECRHFSLLQGMPEKPNATSGNRCAAPSFRPRLLCRIGLGCTQPARRTTSSWTRRERAGRFFPPVSRPRRTSFNNRGMPLVPSRKTLFGLFTKRCTTNGIQPFI